MTDLPPHTIEELLGQLASGDDKAATRLYRHYHDYLFAFIRHQLSNDSDAEEIAHDVFLSVFKKPQGFHGAAKFSTWLCAIAKNKVYDLLRKRGRAPVTQTLDEELAHTMADPNWDFTVTLENAQSDEALARCRDALPAEQREAIFLVFFEGLGLQAVAERQNCPDGTIKSRLFNARKRLRDCLTRCMQGVHHD